MKKKLLVRDDTAVTGGRLKVLEMLRQLVDTLCYDDPSLRKLYIGIGSGTSAKHALERRHDDYKKDNGINEMVVLYRSTSQHFCRAVEKYLDEYCHGLFTTDYILNRRGGGGGRTTSQPYSYVYLAVKRLGNRPA